MARYLRQSNVEQFVDAYLRKLANTNNLRRERPFIDKAIKLLDIFLRKPCCDDPGFEVAFSGRDNVLTTFVRNQLSNAFDLRRHRNSLERTKTQLEHKLNDPCCDVEVEVQWDNATPGNHQVIFTDQYGNETRTSLVGSGPQTLTLPNRTYKVCVEVLVDNSGEFELTKDAVLVVGGGSTPAVYCPITFDPLGSVYLVTFTDV